MKRLMINLSTLAVMAAFCLLFAIAAAGCVTVEDVAATVEPDMARAGVAHLSSITQHFGPDATNVGLDAVMVELEWTPTKHTFVDVQDNYIVDGARFQGHSAGGGREFFEARAGVQWSLK